MQLQSTYLWETDQKMKPTNNDTQVKRFAQKFRYWFILPIFKSLGSNQLDAIRFHQVYDSKFLYTAFAYSSLSHQFFDIHRVIN